MFYIDIIILLIIILIIVILIYDVYRKNIKIIKKIEMFNELNYDKLGPIKFIDNKSSDILGYFPNGEGENGTLSDEQNKIIKDQELTMTTIRIPQGISGQQGEMGPRGYNGPPGPPGPDGQLFIGPPGKDGEPAEECSDGKAAPPCVPCDDGKDGANALPCGESPPGPPGRPAVLCEEGDPGANGEPAIPCIQSPSCTPGIDAHDCDCIPATCAPAQCENTVNLIKINGDNLVINTPNIDINKTLNMNNTSEICIGSSCINKELIDKINLLNTI